MRTRDLVRTAVQNTFANRTRTALTALAIVVGAFTLAMSLAISTGLNRYIDDTLASVGTPGTLTVTRPADGASTGVRPYDPAARPVDGATPAAALAAGSGAPPEPLTPDDLEVIAGIDGVAAVHTVRAVSVDYLQLEPGDTSDADPQRWQVDLSPGLPGALQPLAAGEQPDTASGEPQIVLPRDFVEPLGAETAADLVGAHVRLSVTDPTGQPEHVRATVVGVADPVVTTPAPVAGVNPALVDAVLDVSSRGLPVELRERWALAGVTVAEVDGVPVEETAEAVKERLAEAGYQGQTIDDLLGQFRAFFDAVLLMLTALALVTLLAGSLGVVNTLLMSVQERTREIGLLKALGLTSRRVFALFCLEAATIGVVSAAVGLSAAVLVGRPLDAWLAAGPLADLPGLQLITFSAPVVLGVGAVIVGIAVVSGSLPAVRAARKDPITALRHE